jgi:hypothetical protein
LVEHQWVEHDAFKKLIAEMDISMQVSFTETFNIVSADAVSAGVPIVVSDEIAWASKFSKAEPTSFDSIISALKRVWSLRYIGIQRLDYAGLIAYNKYSVKLWLEYIRGI